MAPEVVLTSDKQFCSRAIVCATAQLFWNESCHFVGVAATVWAPGRLPRDQSNCFGSRSIPVLCIHCT